MEKQNKKRRITVEDREREWVSMIIYIVKCLKSRNKGISSLAVSKGAGERLLPLAVTKMQTHMAHMGI